MLHTVQKLLILLDKQERKRGFLLLGMILVMALLDMLGVASIMPFMAVLANPEAVQTNAYLAAAYSALGFTDPRKFLFFLGLLAFVALLSAISFKALTTYVLLRFTNSLDYSIGRRLVERYLNQPYEWFLNRHSADLGKSVLSEVSQVVNSALLPAMHLVAHGAVVLALLALLILVNPVLAIVAAVALGGAYVAIYLLLRRYLGHIGAARVRANQSRYQTVQEAFGGIKEVKVSGYERTYLDRYAKSAKAYARYQAASQVAALVPRYALEAVAFGGMLLVVLYLIGDAGGLQTALPMIALYGFAGYRLMPALQQMYAHLARLRFASAALDSLQSDMAGLDPQKRAPRPVSDRICPEQAIELREVCYTYPGAQKPALSRLNLVIPAHTTIGLVGTTGSGKTTTVDLILGLLQPQSGQLYVDDKPITAANLSGWQRSIGYVSQHIYLGDDTVAANIAFGVPPAQIDRAAVERAARIANLHEFIVNELPEGYDTLTGERGVRLSGGQRQRIGIARALYFDPPVLILDEATSALDGLTEQAVMEAVNNLGHKKTIILIAHRLATVRNCDCIYLLEHGHVTAQGRYEDLVANNERFREMAQVIDA